MSRIPTLTDFPKETLVLAWVRRRLRSTTHEQRVAHLAGQLFNLTRHWHDLNAADRRLLTLAAYLHDVGRSLADKGHAKLGARMILHDDSLPLSPTERRRLAFLTRHHRGQAPASGEERHLTPDDDRNRLRILLGLLRAADALDSRIAGGPQLVLSTHRRTLLICGYSSSDDAHRRYARPKKLRLLEQTLDCHISTQWFTTQSTTLVA